VLVFFLAFFLDFFELSFIVIPLLGPVAEKLGIDLIWFGVLLGVNMQTSFMHPPFGFALFYLRSVAPTREYRDKITGKMMAPITTMQIYWGAVPFRAHPGLMVGIVILFPQMVMVYKSDASTVDPSKIQINVEQQGEAPAAGTDGRPPAPPTEDQQQEKADDAAQSLQDAFKAAPVAPGAGGARRQSSGDTSMKKPASRGYFCFGAAEVAPTDERKCLLLAAAARRASLRS
jgi:hypothetical protein